MLSLVSPPRWKVIPFTEGTIYFINRVKLPSMHRPGKTPIFGLAFMVPYGVMEVLKGEKKLNFLPRYDAYKPQQ